MPLAEKKALTVAFVGNPNTGKTTLFNALSGSRQKTGNFPGVTTEIKMASLTTSTMSYRFVDLPGSYSITPMSQDEKAAADYLEGKLSRYTKPDVILFVLDATNLKRNLYLLSQVMELKIPIVAVLTMTDLLENSGISLNVRKLEDILKIPVLPAPAHSASTPEKVFQVLESKAYQRHEKVETFLMKELIKKHRTASKNGSKEIPSYVFPQLRYQWAKEIAEQVEERGLISGGGWIKKLDAFFTHPYSGFAVFMGIMYLMFQLIYSWSAPIMDGIDTSFQFLASLLDQKITEHEVLNSLLIDGIIPGIGSVVIFLPQVIFLFMFIAVLEDSGYIARAIFLMDKLFSWSGLNGRSFVPMLSSFACAVPGIISARVIADHKVRLATILISPLMSCSARLPIYILMIGAFIEPVYGAFWAAFSLFAAHSLGPALALPISKLISRGYQASHKPVFFLEMPPYRTPILKNVIYRGYHAGKKFLLKAGGIILLLSIVIWTLAYFPHDEKVKLNVYKEFEPALSLAQSQKDLKKIEELEAQRNKELAARHLEESYLGRAGKAIQPVFAPLGYDWKITVAILAAFPAREVFLSAMGILYTVGDDAEDSGTLTDKVTNLKNERGERFYTLPIVLSLMVFFSLCSQCMSTLVIIQKELNSVGWAVFTFTYMTALAYLFAFLIYQVGSKLL